MVGTKDLLLYPNTIKVHLRKAYFMSVHNKNQVDEMTDQGKGCAWDR